ncbi:MAG: DNA-directed DNA polymerase [Candidatus Amesbacteria bacterium GW2011_GWA1_44_24]|nr:MAG: DNA-directed DNA polymerase [Candidatus Amesbacteria bacterium GW2011_GWA1_44_24]
MNNMTLYLKYRPQSLADLDLDLVREELTKIVASGNIPHALLFAGPKGTGKTSAARIMAKIVNCESKNPPCNKCQQCLSIMKGNNIDVIELDAASNRGIDDIRVLRDTVKLAPASSRKKVYIIDEAHMLTLEASNALLKTLEEPPDHVLFILATTNPEKLIETIRSRTTLIEFHKASPEETIRALTSVATGEKLKIDKEILFSISKMSKGSFRDAVKILEQLISQKIKLTKDDVEEFLLKRKAFDEREFIDVLIRKDCKKAILMISDFVSKGVDVENVIESVTTQLRKSLLVKVGVGSGEEIDLSKPDLILLIELLSFARSQIALSSIEELPLEIAVIKWCGDEVIQNEEPVKNITTKLSEITDDVWKTILTKVRPINTSIEALLRAARPVGYDGNILTLGVYYKFHKERLEEVSHRKVLEDVAASVMGCPIKVACTLTEPPAKKVEVIPLTETKDNDIIKIAEEIFGN